MSNYTYLSSFIYTYRFRSLRKAAEALNLSQPALSKHIKSLESTFNKDLFYRQHGCQLMPTPAADLLASLISHNIDILDQVLDSESEETTEIRLAADRDVYHFLTNNKIADYASENNINLFMSSHDSDYRFQAILDERLDFAFSPYVIDLPSLSSVELFSRTYTLVSTHQLATELHIDSDVSETYANLQDATWLMLNDYWAEYLKEFFSRKYDCSLKFTSVMNVADDYLLLEQVAKGAGVALLPKQVCRPYLDSGKLVDLLAYNEYPITVKVYLLWKDGRLRDKSMAEFHKYLMNLKYNPS